MKVYFCDICGADLRAFDFTEIAQLSLWYENYIFDEMTNRSTLHMELCDECKERIENFIEELKGKKL